VGVVLNGKGGKRFFGAICSLFASIPVVKSVKKASKSRKTKSKKAKSKLKLKNLFKILKRSVRKRKAKFMRKPINS